MNAIAHIRLNVLGYRQAAFAEVAGVSQPTVSRWEDARFPDEPSHRNLARIREHVLSLGLPWDDAWFFDVPAQHDDRIDTSAAAHRGAEPLRESAND
jgi:transcriptional regulator with XRE-family HTH domain